MTQSKVWKKISTFCDSALLQYLYFIAAVGIVLFYKVEEKNAVTTMQNNLLIYGIIAFVVVASVQLIFGRHIVSTVLPFLLICCYVLKCYDSYNIFMGFLPILLPTAILFFLALMARLFFLNRHKFVPSPAFWSLLPVSIAVLVGGVGFISFSDYIGGAFYVFGLGFGLMALCALFSCQYQEDHTYDLADFYERTMCLVALFAMFMVVHHYILNWDVVVKTKRMLDFQWRNNISTILMITIPFLFSRANKNFLWFFAGLGSAATLLMAASRGGILFGALEILVCIIVFLIRARGVRRIVASSIVAITVAAVIVAFLRRADDIQKAFYRLFQSFDQELLQEESRYKMLLRAWEQFKEHPIFGQGLGYPGTAGIYDPRKGALHFYHCAPAQIIASLGSIGILAYLAQFYLQGRLLWRKRSRFSATVAISICALWGMSMVNPGVFSPVPYAMMIPLHLIVVEKTYRHRKTL